jgi:hypothetical protein
MPQYGSAIDDSRSVIDDSNKGYDAFVVQASLMMIATI